MSSTESESTISFTAPDRRSLVATLCASLNTALAHRTAWERDASLVPWHSTAASFEALPANIIETILAEAQEAGSLPGEIEFSGYLETDNGPRAWGFVAVHGEDQSIGGAVTIDRVRVTPDGAGYRFESRLRRFAGSGG